MAIQQFGDAFKAQITDINRQNDLKAVGMAAGWAIVDGDFFAAGGTGGYNYGDGDSTLINNFWNDVFNGGAVNLRGAGGPGTDGDDWTVAGDAGDTTAGEKLGRLYNLGWEIVDFTLVGNDIRVVNPLTGLNVDNVNAIVALGNKATLIANVNYRTGMGGAAASPRNAALDGTGADAANNDIMNAWFALTATGGGTIADINLPAANARALWDNNWDAADIVDDGAHNIRVVNPLTGLNVDNVNAIVALGNKATLIANVNYRTGMGGAAASPRNAALDGTGADAANNDIMNAWFALTATGGGTIADINLPAANARALWDNNWDAADIVDDGAHNIRVVNPLTGLNVDNVNAIVALGNKATLIANVNYRTGMGGAAASPRNAALDGTGADAANNDIMNAWFALTATGGGTIADINLPAANARALWDNNWDAADIVDDGAHNIRVVNPDDLANPLTGFANINVNKLELGQTVWRGAMIGTAVAAGRNQNLADDLAGNLIQDEWLAKVNSLDITRANLSGAQAFQLWQNNWDVIDIQVNSGDVQVTPFPGLPLVGFNKINGVDKNALNTFVTGFRGVSGDLASAPITEIFTRYKSCGTKTGAQVAADYNKEKLDAAKSTAIIEITTKRDESPKTTDLEIKTELNRVTPKPIDGTTITDWEGYIKAVTTNPTEVNTRKDKVLAAIAAIRKAKKIPAPTVGATRTAAISAITKAMTSKADKEPINPDQLNAKLEADASTKTDYAKLADNNKNWEGYINDGTTVDEVIARERKVLAIIDNMWAGQPDKQKAPATVITKEKVTTIYLTVGLPAPSDTTAQGWTGVVKTDSEKLKDNKALTDFLTEIKGFDTTKLVEVIEGDLTTSERPAGDNPERKKTDLLTNKSPTIIIKTYANYKVKKEKDSKFLTAIQNEMASWKENNDSKKCLEPKDYPKEGDKYTEAAMIKFLCESYGGASHKAVTVSQDGPNTLSTNEQETWTQWLNKLWWTPVWIPLLIVAVIAYFWTNIMNWWNDSADAESDDVNE